MRGKSFCRGCNSENLFRALDLGFSPLANRLVPHNKLESPEPWFPLVLRVCSDCLLGQLGEFSHDAEIFRDYPYLSSTSATWLESNQIFTKSMVDLLGLSAEDLVLELASNDGYLLQFFQALDIRVLGIEPALNVATLASIKGIPTSPEFFSRDLAQKLLQRSISPRLIVAKNVVAHVPNLREFLEGIALLCTASTLVVIEAPSIVNIIAKLQFDTVYHEHFSYLSASFFKKVLSDFGLKLLGCERVETHGGSLRLFIGRIDSTVELPKSLVSSLRMILEEEEFAEIGNSATWRNLSEQIANHLHEFRNWIHSLDAKVVGYGAAAKAVTLLSSAQIPRGSISFCIDNSEGKINHFLPGHQIQIVSEADFFVNYFEKDVVFIIFPWNLRNEIAARIRTMAPKSRIFVALPQIEEVLDGHVT